MKKKVLELPYRKNVSIIPYVNEKFLLVNSSVHPTSWWKFPQGGIDSGEELTKAALREFYEELGFRGGTIRGISDYENYYDWPMYTIEKSNFSFRGQHQKFVLLELPEDVILNPDRAEIKDHMWVSKNDILRLATESKHSFSTYNGVIQRIFDEFAHII